MFQNKPFIVVKTADSGLEVIDNLVIRKTFHRFRDSMLRSSKYVREKIDCRRSYLFRLFNVQENQV